MVDRRAHLGALGCTSQRSRSPASGQKLYTLDLSYLLRPIINRRCHRSWPHFLRLFYDFLDLSYRRKNDPYYDIYE